MSIRNHDPRKGALPMTDTVRVKLENGSQINLPADHPAVTAEGVEVLDKPTHYDNGDPIPAKVVPAVLQKTAEPTIAELKAEIKARNELRDAESQIPTSGNKADLVAALAADDAAQATQGGQSADSEEE